MFSIVLNHDKNGFSRMSRAKAVQLSDHLNHPSFEEVEASGGQDWSYVADHYEGYSVVKSYDEDGHYMGRL